MKICARKFFWILLFAVVLIFCCRLYFRAEVENQKEFDSLLVKSEKVLLAQAVAGTKSQTEMPNAPATSATTTRSATTTSTPEQLFPVVRVIDGDTIVVLINGTDETVRLLGMDTSETVDPRKPVQCFGPEASLETKSLLDGREVSLQSDEAQSDRDKYGRLLRYVFRDDGLFVDEFLVKQGFAREYTYFGVAYKYQTAFRTDQVVARNAGLGLWATSTCNGKR